MRLYVAFSRKGRKKRALSLYYCAYLLSSYISKKSTTVLIVHRTPYQVVQYDTLVRYELFGKNLFEVLARGVG